jgi:hypothetical protein
MKKVILIFCSAMICSFFVFASNSFAARGWRSDHQGRVTHYEKNHKPPSYRHGQGFRPHPNRYHYQPAPRFRHKLYQWNRRPFYRHGHPRHYHGRYPVGARQIVVQEHNYYHSNADSYAGSGDEFNASASVSDTGFSVSVGVSQTD